MAGVDEDDQVQDRAQVGDEPLQVLRHLDRLKQKEQNVNKTLKRGHLMKRCFLVFLIPMF